MSNIKWDNIVTGKGAIGSPNAALDYYVARY